MEAFLPILFVALFVGTISLVIVAAVRAQKRSRANITRLAEELQLPVPEAPKGFFAGLSGQSLAGSFRGRPLRVFTYTTGSGKNRTSWCAFALTVPNPSRWTLRVSRENLLTKAGRAFGLDDVALGDAHFDDQFFLKSNDPGYVRAAFIPEVREPFIAAWKAGARGTITVEGDEIKYAEVGSFSSDKICGRFPALVELGCLVGDLVDARRG